MFCTDLKPDRDFCCIRHFITVVESVYCAVRTASLYEADYVWSLNNRGGKSLQCGRTDALYEADYVWSLSNRGGKCLQRGTD